VRKHHPDSRHGTRTASCDGQIWKAFCQRKNLRYNLF
jgi:hypothetical protein